jgi:hypothetical protein
MMENQDQCHHGKKLGSLCENKAQGLDVIDEVQ